MVQSKEEKEREVRKIAHELIKSWDNPPPKTEEEKSKIEEEKWAVAYKKYKFLNNDKKCYVCGRKPEDNYNLIKHHVKYFPCQIIAYVHFKCHQEIHDGKHPDLIQYKRQESEKFYSFKQKRANSLS